MAEHETITVALIGMTGCGKTTVGRLAAARLGWDFADLDEAIVAGEGRSVREIFGREGEDGFRALETDYLRRLTEQAAENRILACGGGAPLRAATRALLTGTGIYTVWIRRRPELVFAAPGVLARPPLCGSRETYLALYAAREPVYRAAARTVLENENSERTAETLCRLIRDLKEER